MVALHPVFEYQPVDKADGGHDAGDIQLLQRYG
jgi:hypothetical protein